MDASALAGRLEGAVVLGPMTKGCNLPYRRLCLELGAGITMGEMAVARQLVRGRNAEFALVLPAPGEPCFGVQIAAKAPEEAVAGALLAAEKGAHFLDLNLGCPIHDMVRRGLGSALMRRPEKVGRLVEALVGALEIPVTVKIRLGYSEEKRNAVEVARVAEASGAAAVFVHGRTRAARYRTSAEWSAIGEVVQAVDIPVVGNGDLLDLEDVRAARAASGCSGVMVARGALIKPWIFREIEGDLADPGAEERLGIYRRYVELGYEHWGESERGRGRLAGFLEWHLDFWTRFVPRRPGHAPKLQERDAGWEPGSGLEAVLARRDLAARGWLAGRLLGREAIDPEDAPPPGDEEDESGGESAWQA